MKTKSIKKNVFKVIAMLLAVLFAVGGLAILLGSVTTASAADSESEEEHDHVTEDDFITVVIDGCVVRYPVVYGNNGAMFAIPCVHACLRCGKCTLEHPCNEIDGHTVKCECKEPLLPTINEVEYKSSKAKVFEYDALANSEGIFESNLRSVIGYRSAERIYYVELPDDAEEEIVSIKISTEDIKLLDEKKAEFWWVSNAKRERIEQYILDKSSGYIQFAAKKSGSYVISSHMFNQPIVSENALISEATCTEPAKYHYSCDCGVVSEDDNNYFTSGDPKGHHFTSSKVALEANCSETGLQIRYCEDCDYTEQDELPAKGHSYGDVVLTRLPSQTVNGELKYTCSVCGNIYRDQLPLVTDETDVGNYKTEDSSSSVFVVFTIIFGVLFVAQTALVIMLINKQMYKKRDET